MIGSPAIKFDARIDDPNVRLLTSLLPHLFSSLNLKRMGPSTMLPVRPICDRSPMVVQEPSTDWLPSRVIWPSPEARTYL